jgi:hypothetical protein
VHSPSVSTQLPAQLSIQIPCERKTTAHHQHYHSPASLAYHLSLPPLKLFLDWANSPSATAEIIQLTNTNEPEQWKNTSSSLPNLSVHTPYCLFLFWWHTVDHIFFSLYCWYSQVGKGHPVKICNHVSCSLHTSLLSHFFSICTGKHLCFFFSCHLPVTILVWLIHNLLSYNSRGASKGTAQVEFRRNKDSTKAFQQYNKVKAQFLPSQPPCLLSTRLLNLETNISPTISQRLIDQSFLFFSLFNLF